VVHLVVGLPPGPRATGPDWVVSVGGALPGYERECRACGYTWTPGRGGQGALFRGFFDLLAYAGVGTSQELAQWLGSRLAPDVAFDWDESVPVVWFSRTALPLGFPMTDAEFWEAVQLAHDAVPG
jgi:hypothetical protein